MNGVNAEDFAAAERWARIVEGVTLTDRELVIVAAALSAFRRGQRVSVTIQTPRGSWVIRRG